VDRASCYERLEFLGDSVLSTIISSYLYERYPEENEGFLTSVRSRLVSGSMLAGLASRFTPFCRFALEIAVSHRGEAQRVALQEVCYDAKVQEDVFEAFLGAMFIDLGFGTVRDWLVGFVERHVDFAEVVANQRNPKSELNALCKVRFGYVPTTATVSSRGGGFSSTVRDACNVIIGTGQGASKSEAEMSAAKSALQVFGVFTRT
jgi:ribonuclease-3